MNTHTRLIQYPAHIEALRPYVPGVPVSDLARRLKIPVGNIVKLASNENPLGASTRALQALAETPLDLSQYPDNDCTELVTAIAGQHQVPREWVVVGAGSESVIGNAVATLLCAGRKTVYSQYSFQAYVNAVQRIGASGVEIPSPDHVVDLDGLLQGLEHEPSMIYIANPGNPTGTCLDPVALEAFLNQVPPHVVVLLDEAYFEFLPPALQPDSVAWVRKFPNLLITRTFSKAFGLAGLRVGYGIAQPVLADMLKRARPPFTVSEPAQIAATAALGDQEFLARTMENNAQGMRCLQQGLQALGLRYLESHTNFLLVEVGDGLGMSRFLEHQGFIARPVNSYGLPGWVRISIGLPDQMQRLVNAMAGFASSQNN